MSDETPPEKYRTISYSASEHFTRILAEANVSLLVSTYHAGKVLAVGTHEGKLVVEPHNFELAMGLALHPRFLAVGARHDIWRLDATRKEIAAAVEPAGKYDACLVTRRSFHTGTIAVHEMAFCGDELWIVNTLFSCLCTLDERFNFVPRWKPRFISEVKEANDRCHLNGLAKSADGKSIRYVTAMSTTDEPMGWRNHKLDGGVVIDVPSGEIVSQGLCMPHSPRIFDGKLWVLHSGLGELQIVDPADGKRTTVERFPGYTRGLSFRPPFAFVGLSRIRETSVFGGIPIAENPDDLHCGVGVVDLRSGRTVATLKFTAGVEEIFSVEAAVGVRCPAMRGPHLPLDGLAPIWIIPPLQA